MLKFNTRYRYALRVMIELSRHAGTGGMLQKDIAESQDISSKYLDHIIASLREARLIKPYRGRRSGYELTREPDSITIGDIFSAIDRDLSIMKCLAAEGYCTHEKECLARDFWAGLNNCIQGHLQSVTLKNLITTEMTRASEANNHDRE